MAAFNKFNIFTKNLIDGVHNFATHTIKAMLTNTAPVNTNAVFADLVEITAANGYAAGGPSAASTTATAAGVAKVTLAVTTVTAAGGSIGPFRYTVVYNSTPSSPLKPLVGWYDYGSSITLADGESLTMSFDQTNGLFDIT